MARRSVLKKKETKEVFKKIYENYNSLNSKMVEEIELASIHDTITGNYREEMWMNFFRSIIPKKYCLAQGVMIIDSYGRVSKEVDIAVYDEQYTPYVFQYNTLKFIPIEAVSVVIECKSTSLNKAKLVSWANSISKLETNQRGLARFAQGYTSGMGSSTQKRTQPVKILVTMHNITEKNDRKNLKYDLNNLFDLIVAKSSLKEGQKFNILIKNKDKSLLWWGERLNGVNPKDNARNMDVIKEWKKLH